MGELEDTVKKDVLECIDLFGKYLDVKDYDVPEVVMIPDARTSSYHKIFNTITIAGHDVNEGHAYFEEIAHYFRMILNPDNELYSLEDTSEFYGRLGESIGKNLLAGNELSRLYENTPERSISDLDYFSNYLIWCSKDITNQYITEKNMIIAEAHEREILTALKKFSHNSMKNYSKYRKKPHVYRDVQGKDLKEYIDAAKRCDVPLSKRFNDMIYPTIDLMMDIKNSINTIGAFKRYNMKKEIREVEKKIKSANEGIIKIIDVLDKRSVDEERIYMRLNLQNDVNSSMKHLYGYIAAEIFMKENPDYMDIAPELFRMKDKDVEDNIIEKTDFEPYRELYNHSAVKDFRNKRITPKS